MDFSLPAGNSRRRRRLKKPGAGAPGFTRGLGAVSHQQASLGIYRGIACRYLKAHFRIQAESIKVNILFIDCMVYFAIIDHAVNFMEEPL